MGTRERVDLVGMKLLRSGHWRRTSLEPGRQGYEAARRLVALDEFASTAG